MDYFWTEAGSFGKKRQGHFEDLTSSSRCLPTTLGAAHTPAFHTHTPHTHTLPCEVECQGFIEYILRTTEIEGTEKELGNP